MRARSARWLIVGAVEPEVRRLVRKIEGPQRVPITQGRAWLGTWKGCRLGVVRTGIGPEKARKSVRAALSAFEGLRGVISMGYAGALSERGRVGDLVIPADVVPIYPGAGMAVRTEPGLFEAGVGVARSTGLRVHTGRMLTTDRVAASARAKRELGARYGAESVEMESAVIGEEAGAASLPFLAVRVISDEVGFQMPDTLALLRLWKQKRLARLALRLGGSPLDVARYGRLLVQTRRANAVLDAYLGELLPGLESNGERRQSMSKK